MSSIIIAIDGHSSCGKSTLAKSLAKRLGYAYIDTGAMYRAVAQYLLKNNISHEDTESVENALKSINISFKNINGNNTTYLNGENVENAIRTMEVSSIVSEVAAISPVRTFLVAQQKAMGRGKGIVMDGRDIGTVVFPAAELKVFMTARQDIRANRRLKELEEKGVDSTYEKVLQNLKHRDTIDSTRKDSPLLQAEDAKLLDNSALSPNEQVDIVYNWAKKLLNGASEN